MSQPGPFGRRHAASPPPEPDAGPESAPGRPRPPAGVSSYTWLLGVVLVLGIGYLVLSTVRADAPGTQGVGVGEPLPPFAAPLAGSTRRCEGGGLCNANVAVRAGDEVRRAACDVRLPDVLNVCALAARGPVALAFVSSRSERCQDQVDVMERVRGRYPRIGVAAVFVRGDRADLRATVRRRGWGLPVAHDANGAAAGVYAVAACPTLTFARRGGTVQSTSLEFLDEAALSERLEAIAG